MRLPRPFLTLLLLVLGLPLLWPHPGAPAPSDEVPVQVRLQADLALRLIRLADLAEGELPPPSRTNLETLALSMLDQGLAHRPENPDLLLRRALLSARAGNLPEALALLSEIQDPGPTISAIQRAWKQGRPGLDRTDSIRESLDGYALYLALNQTGCVEAAQALRPEQEARARKDLGLLALLAGLTLISLSLGTAAWIGMPWVIRQRPLQGGPPHPTRWDPLGALACLVGFQVLVALFGGSLFTALGALGLSKIATGVATQILIYLLALAGLARLLPRLARPEGACRPIALLGLSRPRGRDLLAGLIGFWMALPAVLAASWATSAILGHSPVSSNPALERILSASPGELLALGVLIALAAPLFEEILFRGVLFGGLRRPLGPWGAGLVSSVLFALLHGDPQAGLVLAVLGGIFAALYHKTGSLWPAVLAHALWNGATVTAMLVLMANR